MSDTFGFLQEENAEGNLEMKQLGWLAFTTETPVTLLAMRCLQELEESRAELLNRVNHLKKVRSCPFGAFLDCNSVRGSPRLAIQARRSSENLPHGEETTMSATIFQVNDKRRTRYLQKHVWWSLGVLRRLNDVKHELGDLRKTLNDEVDQLRTEFQDLRNTLRQQLEATASLAQTIMGDQILIFIGGVYTGRPIDDQQRSRWNASPV
eukprot:1176020-Prorocentrum_minimum.AAC.2